MFEAPIDAWYVWVGLAVVSSTVFGVVSALPAAQPPDASETARVVDGVAASEYDAVGNHPLPSIEGVRIGADSISVRNAGGVDHAAFGYDRVTPVREGSPLEPILDGKPPNHVFDSRTVFELALRHAQTAAPNWKHADKLTARRVSWGEMDAVLVG